MNGYSFIFWQGNISNPPSKKQGLRTEKNWKKVVDQLTKDTRNVCNCCNFNQNFSQYEKLTSLIFYRVFATPFPLP